MPWVWKFLVAWSFTPCTSRFERGAGTSYFHASRSGSCALTRCRGPVWGELRGRDTSGVFRRMWSPCGGAGEGWWPTGYSGLWAIYGSGCRPFSPKTTSFGRFRARRSRQ